MARKPYPSDVTDDEWAFVAPYLTLMREDAPQRQHDLREVFNGLAVDRADRFALAVYGQRSAAVGSGLPARTAMDQSWRVMGRAKPASNGRAKTGHFEAQEIGLSTLACGVYREPMEGSA
jgi:transposase